MNDGERVDLNAELARELGVEKEISRQFIEVNHALRNEVQELQAQLKRALWQPAPDDDEVMRVLGQLEPDSTVMRVIRRLIDESYRAACTASQDPRTWKDALAAAHHAGGAHYMANLHVMLVDTWQRARARRVKR